MEHVWFFLGLISAACALALVEIQIEGEHGWAARLPTWRLDCPWYSRLFPGRPLTGYHFWLLVFVALVAHLPFAFGLVWSVANEMRAISFVLLFWVCEDFAWFVFNPHFGLRKFRRDQIAWHARAWWWVAPRDYWVATAVALLLYIVSRQPEPMFLALHR